MKAEIKLIPPDGGWGWLIVIGSSLINFSTKAIEPSFGFLFGDLLKQLNVEITGASMVISTLDGMINFSGLIVGPLIKRYTYRKVAILGGILSSAAILLTTPANSMLHILITFGLLGGIGFGLATTPSLVGINDYFSKKKGQAVGLSMAGTALGFMIMPQIVRILLDEYDFHSALLIIGALSLHAVVGACLFQPVSWHLETVLVEDEKEEAHSLLPPVKIEKEYSSDSIETLSNGIKSNLNSPSLESRKLFLNVASRGFPRKPSLISNISLLDDVGNALHIHDIGEEESTTELENVNIENQTDQSPNTETRQVVGSWWSRLSKFFDLNLLTDGVYLNILYGLSMVFVVEMNFKLIVPFFLLDLGFTKSEIAFSLSIMAVADVLARVIVPPILDKLTFSRRATFMFGSLFMAIGRSGMCWQPTFGTIITVLIIVGFFRGISLTSFPLVLTEYSSGNNFPSLLGLSMVSRGIFIGVLGPLSGYVKDISNSYPVFIHSQTLLIMSVVIAWNIEFYITHPRSKKKEVGS